MAQDKKEEKTTAQPSGSPVGKAEKKVKIKFKKPSDFGEKWVGESPKDRRPDLDREVMEQFKEKDLIGATVGVFGYLQLTGNYEGEERPFAIMCCCSEENTDEIFTVMSSGEVILKKLRRIGDKGGFPILGKFVKPEGKRYYDLVDA